MIALEEFLPQEPGHFKEPTTLKTAILT